MKNKIFLDGGSDQNNSLFILGDLDPSGKFSKVFYQGSNLDFARIRKFDIRNSAKETEFDQIQLAGQISDYKLIQSKSEAQIIFGSRVGSRFESRLIAKVNILGDGELDLKNHDHFKFIDAPDGLKG